MESPLRVFDVSPDNFQRSRKLQGAIHSNHEAYVGSFVFDIVQLVDGNDNVIPHQYALFLRGREENTPHISTASRRQLLGPLGATLRAIGNLGN